MCVQFLWTITNSKRPHSHQWDNFPLFPWSMAPWNFVISTARLYMRPPQQCLKYQWLQHHRNSEGRISFNSRSSTVPSLVPQQAESTRVSFRQILSAQTIVTIASPTWCGVHYGSKMRDPHLMGNTLRDLIRQISVCSPSLPPLPIPLMLLVIQLIKLFSQYFSLIHYHRIEIFTFVDLKICLHLERPK